MAVIQARVGSTQQGRAQRKTAERVRPSVQGGTEELVRQIRSAETLASEWESRLSNRFETDTQRRFQNLHAAFRRSQFSLMTVNSRSKADLERLVSTVMEGILALREFLPEFKRWQMPEQSEVEGGGDELAMRHANELLIVVKINATDIGFPLGALEAALDGCIILGGRTEDWGAKYLLVKKATLGLAALKSLSLPVAQFCAIDN